MRRNTGPNPTLLTQTAPLWRLVNALRSAGWGILQAHHGQLRNLLVVLTQQANRAGHVTATREQLAELAGVSPRTVQRLLPQLVAVGLIDYTPGYWMGRRGYPSRVVIHRRALWAAINPARWAQHTRRLAQEAARQARTAGLKYSRRWRTMLVPAPVYRETVCLPSSPTEELGAAPPPPPPPTALLSDAARRHIAAATAAIQLARSTHRN